MPVKYIIDVAKSQSIRMTKGNNYLNLFRWFYCFCIMSDQMFSPGKGSG